MTELVARDVRVAAGGKVLVDAANASLRGGELVAVLGPNGAGKTTLTRVLAGILEPDSGSVMLDGEAVAALPAAARARRLAYLPQNRPLAWPNPVRDVVALGRYAHGGTLGRLGDADRRAVDAAIAACDLAGFEDRSCDTLSGGELARVHLARALAAEAPLLLADEPMVALDPRQRFRMAGHLRSFVDDGGGALVVLHDIALAARIADRLLVMNDGRVVADGMPRAILTERLVADVYGVRARLVERAGHVDVHIESAL